MSIHGSPAVGYTHTQKQPCLSLYYKIGFSRSTQMSEKPDDSSCCDSIVSSASTLLICNLKDQETDSYFEFKGFVSGRDTPPQKALSDQELLRLSFKCAIEKRRQEAKAWVSARKAAIKASTRIQRFSSSSENFRPEPKGELKMCLPGAVLEQE